jgi:Domain of Unknown Function (DUF748)
VKASTSPKERAPAPLPVAPRPRWRPAHWRPGGWAKAGIAFAGLIVFLALAGLVPNEPLRRSIEGRMNRSLKGYEARIEQARLQPLGLSLTLKNLVIRQTAHPEPAILVVPTLHASVHWREILFLRVVADFRIDRPKAYVNLEQLRAEAEDETPVKQKGWQQAVEAIYPLKINLLRIGDGELTYIDDDPQRPLTITQLNARASNIRNIHSKDHMYPSPVEATAVVFGSGKADLKGNADFLSEPYAGVKGQFHLAGIPLDYFRPVVAHWNVTVSGGTLSTAGEVEFAPRVRRLVLPEISIEKVKIGYVRKPPAAAEKGLVPAANKKAAERTADETAPPWDMRLDRFRMTESEVELIDKTKSPGYRVFVTHLNSDVTGLTNTPPGQSATAKLKGKFMDAGEATVMATFQSKVRGGDFDIKLEIGPTPLPKLNDVFRAYGKVDVFAGEFLLNAEVRVQNGYMQGWVKPIFRDVEIYDKSQDAGKPFFKKVYEGVVDTASKLLKNRKHDQVATATTIEGPVGDAKSSMWEVLGGLLKNAFIKAILPGFDRDVGTLPKK